MEKLSYYKRKKLEQEEKIKHLTNQIITLVEDKDIEKICIIKTQWKIKLDVDKQIWQGNSDY